MSGLSRPRSKSGCWTCRTRKVKCDETRPHCGKCLKGRRQCDYAPRKRAPRGTGGRSQKAYAALCSKSDVVAIAPATSGLPLSKLVALEPDLPYGIKAEDWPFPLTATDRRAIDHYAANIVPRMVLKTARWSSYSYVLLMCAKHPLLAHLLIAFAIRDMAKDDDNDLLIRTIEHYQKALSLFIEHLSAPDVTGWITFPALWLFIQYEQSYGNSPNVLKAHLQGVRDIIVTHGAAILPGSLGGPNASPDEPLKYWVPPQMIDRMALWTIHHDARASTFGLGGSIISLLEEEYPGAIANICKNSTNALSDAWGPQYPAQEEIWDMRMEKFWIILHEATMLRFELSNIEKNDAIDPVKLISFGHKLRDLEQRSLNIRAAALSRRIKRSDLLSNACVITAEILALTIRHDILVYGNRPSPAVSQVLQVCHSLYEYEGGGYLWRAAWPMFVAAFETPDPIHQAWVLDRFAGLQTSGQNMRRAHDLLKAVFMEMRITGQHVEYLTWIRDERFPRFVI